MGAGKRCGWAGDDPLMIAYHDEEWGVPVHDDRRFFEFLILEGAQAGLSWSTVLRKRERYREVFAGFDPARVAKFGARDVARLLKDPGIIRNRLKVEGAIRNAKAFLAIQAEHGSFDAWVWSFVGGQPIVNRRRGMRDVPGHHTGVRRALARAQEARLHLRRLDHHVRVHAGHRDGQRPSDGLRPLASARRQLRAPRPPRRRNSRPAAS